jgi:hypothetical protein
MLRFGGVATIVLIAVFSVSVRTAAAEDDEPSLVRWLIPEAVTTKFDVYFGNVPGLNFLDPTVGLNILDETVAMSDPDPYDALPEFRFRMNFLLHSGFDVWRHGAFAHAGVVWSPKGVDREGFALKLIFGGGAYGYNSGALNNTYIIGRQLAGAIMPGWRFVRNGWIVSIFAGVDRQAHKLWPDDPGAGLRGGYTGLRTAFELWYDPTPQTMITADASVSTIGPSYSARAAFGWTFLRLFYIGPEVQGLAADSNYKQIRGGMHLTSFKTRMTEEWSLGVGAAHDSDDRTSVYARFGYLIKR